MDAANLAEKKELKQAFVLATLISTIAGTFITGINLYDRLIEQRRQRKRDKGQNKRIKELESRLNSAEEERAKLKAAQEKRGRKQKEDDDHDSGDNDNGDGDDNDKRITSYRHLRRSLEHGGPNIQREYDRFYKHMGQKFAQGDLVAQTQLQSQIIVLQSTVIKLLEEALITGQPPDLGKLYNTSEFAREGSIRALQDQYQRLLQSAPVSRRGPRPGAPIRRTSSTPSLRKGPHGDSWDYPPPQKALPPPDNSTCLSDNSSHYAGSTKGPLFCPYAVDLQRDASPTRHTPPHSTCPACGVLMAEPSTDRNDREKGQLSWRIEKDVVLHDRPYPRGGGSTKHHEDEERIDTRRFVLSPRFVAKCHRPDSRYACYLCFCHRDRDTLCRTEEALVSHIAGQHSIAEYKQDWDMREVVRTLPYR